MIYDDVRWWCGLMYDDDVCQDYDGMLMMMMLTTIMYGVQCMMYDYDADDDYDDDDGVRWCMMMLMNDYDYNDIWRWCMMMVYADNDDV